MVAVGNVHNTRILRFLIVLMVVILTIFIYASYSTTSTLTPQHMRSASAAALIGSNNGGASHQLIENRSNELRTDQQQQYHSFGLQLPPSEQQTNRSTTAAKTLHKTTASAESLQQHKKSQHRVPTIDADALNDGGAAGAEPGPNQNTISGNDIANEVANDIADVPDEMVQLGGTNDLEEQYVQNVENLMGNINNSGSDAVAAIAPKQQNQQQQLLQQQPAGDGDILIPTSNLQKFIENADKILKNMTTNSSSLNPGSAVSTGPGLPVEQSVASAAQTQNDKTAVPQPPEVTQEQRKEQQQQQSQPQKQVTAEQVQEKGNQVKNNDAKPLPPSSVIHILTGTAAAKDGQVAANVVSGSSSSSSSSGTGAVSPPIAAAPAPAPAESTSKAKVTKPAPKSPPKKVASPLDPSKGVPTESLYESGHLNDEIDIEQICPKKGADLKLLILITSAQTHVEARLAIRQTWGHYGSRRDVSTAFVLGRTTNETINKVLSQENFIYGDLIRGNFIDSYNNLTLKTLSSLEWVDQHCSQAKYILKTDDDMFINIPKLLSFLDKHKDKRVIYGRLAKKWKPIRNKKSKYYVSSDQFAASVFPAFTTGPAYVMTSDIVHDLYVRSLKTVYLKLEDVFTTGIVAQVLSIKRVHVNEFLNRRISFNPCNIRNAISVHMIKSNEQFDLWKKLLDQTTKCK